MLDYCKPLGLLALLRSALICYCVFSLSLLSGCATSSAKQNLTVSNANVSVIGASNKSESKPVKLPVKQSLNKSCSEALSYSQKLIESDDFLAAEKHLQLTLQRNCLSAYEQSQVWRLQAYVYSVQRKFPQAIATYQQVIDSAELDIVSRSQALYTLAQIRFINNDYSGVVESIERGRNLGIVIDNEPESLLARSYHRLDRSDQAIRIMERVIDGSENSGREVKEAWLSLLWSLYYNEQAYRDAVLVGRKLMSQFPKQQYLQQMALICDAGEAADLCQSNSRFMP
jgi:tetratricopeptide (TPR) repeat protein